MFRDILSNLNDMRLNFRWRRNMFRNLCLQYVKIDMHLNNLMLYYSKIDYLCNYKV